MTTEEIIHYVSPQLFAEMEQLLSTATIATEQRIKGVFPFQRQWHTVTGGAAQHGGWLCFSGYRVVYQELYDGELPPLQYSQHWRDVEQGNRARCYNGMLVNYGQKRVVLVGPELIFKPLAVPNLQLTLDFEQ